MRALQRMENPRHHGPITCLCLDRKRTWIICGTSTGVLPLWDIRFGILVKSWKVGDSLKGKFGTVHQCVVHPTKGKGKWIVVAVETHKTSSSDNSSHTLLKVWDIEKTMLVESFVSRTVVSSSNSVEDPRRLRPGKRRRARLRPSLRSSEHGRKAAPATRPSGDLISSAQTPLVARRHCPFPDVRAIVAAAEFCGHTVTNRSHMALSDGKTSTRSSRGFIEQALKTANFASGILLVLSVLLF